MEESQHDTDQLSEVLKRVARIKVAGCYRGTTENLVMGMLERLDW
jgi:hypothetical protein